MVITTYATAVRDIEALVAGTWGLLLLKEIGLPIPVPGDILVLGAGAATSGRPEAAAWLLAILLAGYVGGTIQFFLVRGAMRGPLLALLRRLGIPQARLEAMAETLRNGGVRAIAVARATPGLRIAAIAASGIAALPPRTFLTGFVVGNTIFVGSHFALGFVLGKPAAPSKKHEQLTFSVPDGTDKLNWVIEKPPVVMVPP